MILAALAAAALPSLAAAGACTVREYDGNFREIGEATSLAADDPLCRRLDVIEGIFDSLLPGADALLAEQPRPAGGPAPKLRGTISFTREILRQGDSYNAGYWRGGVFVTPEFLRKTEPYPELARLVMAHELGHAMQDALGAGRHPPCDRVYEAQADVWGFELLRRSGAATGAIVKGAGQDVADRVGPEKAEENASEDGMLWQIKEFCTHPAYRLRYVNAVVAAHAPTGRHALGAPAALSGLDAARMEDGAAFDGGGTNRDGRVQVPAGRPAPPPLPGRESFDPAGRYSVPARLATPPPAAAAKPGPSPDPDARRLRGALAAALYELGQATGWTDPLVSRFIGRSAGKDFEGVYGAILAGIDALSPTQVALAGALAMARRALAHVQAGGPRFSQAMLGRPELTVPSGPSATPSPRRRLLNGLTPGS